MREPDNAKGWGAGGGMRDKDRVGCGSHSRKQSGATHPS